MTDDGIRPGDATVPPGDVQYVCGYEPLLRLVVHSMLWFSAGFTFGYFAWGLIR